MGRRVACVLVYPGAFLCTEDFNERYLCKNSFEYNFYNITKGFLITDTQQNKHTGTYRHKHTQRHTDTHTHTHTHTQTHAQIHTETCKDIQKNTGTGRFPSLDIILSLSAESFHGEFYQPFPR